MSKKVIINCNEATTICNKNQYREASTLDKLKLSFHNFLCKKCKLYSEQNAFMTKLFKVHLHKSDKEKHLCTEDKETLQKEIKKELQKAE
jgi:hypothetical protein